VDAQVLENEADRLVRAHEGSELARAAAEAAQVEAAAQAEYHPNMGVETIAQVEAHVLVLTGAVQDAPVTVA
jgi:hypothetical protein